MTREAFDAAMPEEFWREVVDRVAAEAPDTLLLAEAFWLMEGYFVRTLGMHRVYNSAFMNMLRDEKNAKYRLVVKNTLEFDPEILKRYVNFMNNPDERTAIDQFGTGDKYFGIATVLATLPGLPMFGHGQVEGFAEKYGMEFRRAYWDERPNEGLVARHEWQLFPLLHRRRLFAEVRDFRFYDVVDDAGHVNEDVLAYSNRRGGERTPRDLPQPLRIDARADPRLGRLRREGRGRGEAPRADVAGRWPGPLDRPWRRGPSSATRQMGSSTSGRPATCATAGSAWSSTPTEPASCSTGARSAARPPPSTAPSRRTWAGPAFRASRQPWPSAACARSTTPSPSS